MRDTRPFVASSFRDRMGLGAADPDLRIGRTFVHSPLPARPLSDRIEEGIGRIYTTPVGEFHSVTTVLGRAPLDKDPNWLEKWRGYVGDQAAWIAGRGAARGTRVHELVEGYVLGKKDFAAGAMPINLAMFKKLRRIIDTHVGTVYGVEVPLYSERLKTAGRCDFVCGYRGFNTVMDWKSTTNPWEEHRAPKALIQAATYATMIEELFGLNIPRVAVVVVSEAQETQVFWDETDKWREWVERIFARREFD